MRWSRRWGSVGAISMFATLGLAACSDLPLACPAIGWMNTLTVELDGNTADIEQVQLCIEDGCAPADNIDLSGPLALIALTGHDGNSWTFSTDMTTPDQLTVRVLAADGAVITNAEVVPSWVRVGGSEQCGGPGVATLTVEI